MPRDRQRGNSLLLALIVMSALAALGSLTVVSVQSSLKASTNDRSQAIAMYAAESGAAIAAEHLRYHFDDGVLWSAFVVPRNDPTLLVPLAGPALPSSGAQPGTAENPFSPDQNAWYSVTILNNRDDTPGFVNGVDGDGQVIIQSTGHGPQGSVAVIEWEIRWPYNPPPPPPPPFPPPPPPPPPTRVLAVPPPPFPATPPKLVLLGWHVVNL